MSDPKNKLKEEEEVTTGDENLGGDNPEVEVDDSIVDYYLKGDMEAMKRCVHDEVVSSVSNYVSNLKASDADEQATGEDD